MARGAALVLVCFWLREGKGGSGSALVEIDVGFFLWGFFSSLLFNSSQNFSPPIKIPPLCVVTSIYTQSGLIPKTHRSFYFFIFCKF